MDKKDLLINKKELFEDSGLLNDDQIDLINTLKLQLNKSFLKVAIDCGIISRKAYAEALHKFEFESYAFDYENIENLTFFNEAETDISSFLNALAFPFLNTENELVLIVSDPSDTNNIKNIEANLDSSCVHVFVADELDILKALHIKYGGKTLHKAVFNLYEKDPKSSAIETFTLKQIYVIGILMATFIISLYLKPIGGTIFFNLLLNLFLLFSIAFKFVLTIAGSKTELENKVTDYELRILKDEELPIYTILLPVFKESEVIYKLAWNLKNMDYPLEKLDVKLLIESDDEVTINAVKAMKFPAIFEPVIIPYAMPKTKPKACNYGLYFSKGKYLTIYDAEDIPDSNQLKKVCVLFEKIPKEYVVVQCALNYFNKSENFLTKMFTLEYSYWFDYLLPGLDRLNIPIPLGGTSNHFKFDKLMELGGWDGFNVTEDADLGLRSYAKKYKIAVLDSTTLEEANNEFFNWIRQRSRWIKGYMQTYLVHMRNPVTLIKSIGFRAFFGFQFFIGGTIFTFLTYPILLVFFIVCLFISNETLQVFFPDWVLIISVISFTVGNLMMIYINMIAVFKRNSYGLIVYALLNPVYWIMHSISAYKGLIQLITKPFFWEKTNHGLTKTNKK